MAKKQLFKRFDIELEFTNGIAGGRPATAALAQAHILKFSEGVSNALKLSEKVEGVVTEEAMQEYMMNNKSVFPVDEGGIYIRGFQFNAMLKDAAQRLKETRKTQGLGKTIRDGGLHFPYKIYLGVEPNMAEEAVKPDAAPSGSIKLFQTADIVNLKVPCAVMDNGDLPVKLFNELWEVAQGMGLGSQRHLGYGQFIVNSVESNKGWASIAPLLRRTGYDASGEPMPEVALDVAAD
jgi:hypothetical protein|tara:strand:+ start:207 stop:914 length:708 start_codon:yes stop_codon:yes gene_type:complete